MSHNDNQFSYTILNQDTIPMIIPMFEFDLSNNLNRFIVELNVHLYNDHHDEKIVNKIVEENNIKKRERKKLIMGDKIYTEIKKGFIYPGSITYEYLQKDNYLIELLTTINNLLGNKVSNEKLFEILFDSPEPSGEQILKRSKIIGDLTRFTIIPMRSCLISIFNKKFTKHVVSYLFMNKSSKIYMIVNTWNGSFNKEPVKIAEHIYIHRSPSKIIERWANKIKEKPLAKELHKYALSIIQPNYIVSTPLDSMDPIFNSLEEEGFIQKIPSHSRPFHDFISENLLRSQSHVFGTISTCEPIVSTLFSVIKIPQNNSLLNNKKGGFIRKKYKSLRNKIKKSIRKTKKTRT